MLATIVDHVRRALKAGFARARSAALAWTRPATRPVLGVFIDHLRSPGELAHENAILRKQIEMLAAVGTPQHEIARLHGMGVETLRRHDKAELKNGATKANASELKPVRSRSKPRLSSSSNSRRSGSSSQPLFSASLLSAITNAFFWAGVSPVSRIVGTAARPSLRAAGAARGRR